MNFHIVTTDRTVPLIVLVFCVGVFGVLTEQTVEGEIPQSCEKMVLNDWQIRCDGEGIFAGARLRLDDQKIDLNQASVMDLKIIPRLSKKVAHKIILQRKRLGKYKNFDELSKIKGVGPKTKERLENFFYLTFDI